MYLHKYRIIGKHLWRMLMLDEVYFAKYENLNDRDEYRQRYDLTASRNEKIWYFNKMAAALFPEESADRNHERAVEMTDEFDNIKGDDQAINDWLARGTQTIGILSISSSWKIQKMWDMYAGSGNGVVVGICRTKLKAWADQMFTAGREMWLKDVRYVPKGTKIKFFSTDVDTHLVYKVATKYDEWSYEREVRVLANNKAGVPVRLPHGIIEEVRLGWKVSEADVRKIIDICNRREIHCHILAAPAGLLQQD